MRGDKIDWILSRIIPPNVNYIGVFPRDKIPDVPKLPACYVVNSDPSTEPGHHWLAVFIDTSNPIPLTSGSTPYASCINIWNSLHLYNNHCNIHWPTSHLSPHTVEFFDSFGLPHYLYQIPITPTHSNATCLQSSNSTCCGDYCIAYLYARSRGFTLINFVNSFTSSYEYNDISVHKWIRRQLHNPPISVHRSSCNWQQVSKPKASLHYTTLNT